MSRPRIPWSRGRGLDLLQSIGSPTWWIALHLTLIGYFKWDLCLVGPALAGCSTKLKSQAYLLTKWESLNKLTPDPLSNRKRLDFQNGSTTQACQSLPTFIQVEKKTSVASLSSPKPPRSWKSLRKARTVRRRTPHKSQALKCQTRLVNAIKQHKSGYRIKT